MFRLLLKTLSAFLLGLSITAALLLIPAGTWHYAKAWFFMSLLFVPILIVSFVLWFKNPELLSKRLEKGEREEKQRGIVMWSGIFLVASLIIAGLDFRFNWSHISPSLTVAASIIQLIGYALYAEVLRENTYLSRIIEIQTGQHVIDTGLYGLVRHPMYLAVTLLYLAIPIVLGSWWALLAISPCILLLAVRIKNEEELLRQDLPGYTDYTHRIRYRMIPFIW